MSKLEFPSTVAYRQRYVTGGDVIDKEFPLTATGNLWRYSNNFVVDAASCDLTGVTSFLYAFQNAGAYVITDFPDSVKPTNMQYACINATKLIEGPHINTSSTTTFENTFNGCSELITIPQYDTSKATSFATMLSSCSKLYSIPALDCSSLTTISSLVGYGSITGLCHLGGFINLGAQKSLSGTTSGFLDYMPNLTKDSLLNVINGLYDRASAGYSVIKIKMLSYQLSVLTDEEIAIATNKGWTLTT